MSALLESDVALWQAGVFFLVVYLLAVVAVALYSRIEGRGK